MATGARALLPKGLLCKGAGTGFLHLPKCWQIPQLRQKLQSNPIYVQVASIKASLDTQ